MVFKRRNKLGIGRRLLHFVAPPKGWRRGVEYIGHRIRRLPDTPHRIAVGLACGTFVSFTPLFGLHFFLSMGLARLLGGNILASLLGTFFGNPLTFPLIASFSLGFGRRILGHGLSGRDFGRVTDAFTEFFIGLWESFWSIFGYGNAQWGKVMLFMEDILFPYLIGGLLPGVISAVAVYFISRPIIVTLQTRHRARALKIAARKRKERKSPSDGVSRQSYVGKKKKPVTG
ncbi:DUF2062 domain-containing protein [Amaricoccus tamworthensis]|uniref:DUF2062 domain-containing protein n=1 Tax=Amaricoccus tamworthensis TaxID=57002 RepID=UPI003C7CD38B